MPTRLIALPPLLAALILALLTATYALAAKQARIGTVAVNLTPPPGFCELEESRATDARMLTAVQGLLGGGGNRLLGMFSDCRQLADWRVGKRQLLDDFVQYQTLISLMDTVVPMQAEEVIKQVCAQTRAEGEKMMTGMLPDIKSRVEQTSKQVKVNEMRFVGVVAEEANACYGAMLTKMQTEVGIEKTQMAVNATTFVNGKIVYYYLFSPFAGADTVTKMLAKHKTNVAAFLAANKN